MPRTFEDATQRHMPSEEELAALDRDFEFHPSPVREPRTLTARQIESFNDRGYVLPLDIFEGDELSELQGRFDAALQDALARGDDGYSLISAHLKHGWIYDLIFHPRIVSILSDILGENFVMWGCHCFCKIVGDNRQVAWHQDASYWPLTPARTVTLWIAIDEVDRENGGMSFVSGSHRQGLIDYRMATESENSVLRQVVDDAQRYGEVVDIDLKAGQASLHSDMLLHGSQPNLSGRRRCGLAMRFTVMDVRCQFGWNSEGVIVRGLDSDGHWGNPPRPA